MFAVNLTALQLLTCQSPVATASMQMGHSSSALLCPAGSAFTTPRMSSAALTGSPMYQRNVSPHSAAELVSLFWRDACALLVQANTLLEAEQSSWCQRAPEGAQHNTKISGSCRSVTV